MRTLVLNADYTPVCTMPLSTESWQDAICLVYKGKAYAIAYYEKEIHTVSETYKIPAVIVLKDYKKPRFRVSYSKRNIKIRDNFTCVYCKEKFSIQDLTVDHVFPKSLGGKATWTNMVSACEPCNSQKQNNPNIKPKVMPRKPEYRKLVNQSNKLTNIDNELWEEYIK